MSREIIQALIPESLSNQSWYSSYVLLAGQLCVWAKLSAAGVLPASLKLDQTETDEQKQDIPGLFNELSGLKSDPLWQTAWQCSRPTFNEIPAEEVNRALHTVITAKRHQLLRYRELSESLADYGLPESQKLPEALAALMLELLRPDTGAEIYLPYLRCFSLAAGKLSHEFKVFSEQDSPQPLEAVCALLNPAIHLADGHPVTEPGCFANGELQQFEYGLTVLSQDHRYKVGEIRDIYGRFDNNNRHEEMLLIQHMLNQCHGRVVMAVPGAFLQKNTDLHQAFRRKLVKQGKLKTIIKLPKGLLPGRSAPLYLLIADQVKSEKINFINADRSYFQSVPVRKKGSARIVLNNYDAIVEQTELCEDGRYSCQIKRSELLEGTIILEPSYYRGEHIHRVKSGIEQSSRALESLVDIIRAQAIKDNPSGNKPFIEVTINDINDAGEVGQPGRVVNVDDKGLKRAQQQQLQAGDILLAIKGQAGKVALVPELCGTNWVANQAFVILRLRNNSILKSPVVLFRFLRSESGRRMLDNICINNNVPFIHGQDLKKLAIPQWSDTEQQQACQMHHEILKLYAQVSFIRDKAQLIENEMLKET